MKVLFLLLILLKEVQSTKPLWQPVMEQKESVTASLDLTNVIKELKRVSAQLGNKGKGTPDYQHNTFLRSKIKEITSQVNMKHFVKNLKRSMARQIQMSLREYANVGNISQTVYVKLQNMMRQEIDPRIEQYLDKIVKTIQKLTTDANGIENDNQLLRRNVTELTQENQEITTKYEELITRFQNLQTTFNGIIQTLEKSCTIPDIPGSTYTTSGTVSNGKLVFGEDITYKCNPNYELIAGDLKRKCTFGSFFSGSTPVCKEKPSCQIPAHEGGAYTVDGSSKADKVYLGGSITYTCNGGYYKKDSEPATKRCVEGPVWSSKRPVCLEDCKRSAYGYEYTGFHTVTSNNRTCQDWKDDSPQRHDYNRKIVDNYCRNPDKEPAPWCYTLDPRKRWEVCAVPYCKKPAKECLESDNGVDYFGTKNVTKSGYTCQEWKLDSPHSHSYNWLKQQKNYCRNPYGTAVSPFCYTTDKSVKWEFCDIANCNDGY